MIASRVTVTCGDRAPNTTCPPRRAFVASDARRRGQVGVVVTTNIIAFGGVLATPAIASPAWTTRCISPSS
jgi:hypothetical protein